MRSDGDDGVVEVAHLHRGEGYLLHRTVDTSLFHRYPVALVEHVVAREAYSCHKSGDGVLEHEHEDGGCGAKSCEQGEGIAVDDYRHNHNHRQEHHHNLEYAAEGVEILVMSRLHVGVKHLQRVDHLDGKSC